METMQSEISNDIEMRSLAVPEEGPRKGDLISLLVIVANHKRVVLRLTALGAVIAIIVALLLPNRYAATTSILPPQQSQNTASMVLSQFATTAGGSLAGLTGKDLGLKNPNDIYVAMLKSRTIADRLITKFDLMRVFKQKKWSSARKDLEKETEIASGKEGLITVSVEDKDPKRAAAIANEYVNELRLLTQTLAVTEASQRRLFFEQQLQGAKDDLGTAEIQLKGTQEKTGMIQLDSQAKAVIEAVGMLRGEIAAKEVQLQAMRTFATDQNPDYILTQQSLAGLRAQLEKLEKQQPLADDDAMLATAKMPAVAMEYIRRLREVKYREAVFEMLAKQYEAAKIDEAKQAAVIQVLDPAIEPDKKYSPRRTLIVTLITIAAFFGSICFVLVLDAFNRVSQDPTRATQMETLRRSLFSRTRNRNKSHMDLS